MKSGKRKAKTSLKTRLKELVKVSLPHLTLILICSCYVSLGAWLFSGIVSNEQTEELAQEGLREAQITLANDIWEAKENNASSEVDLEDLFQDYVNRLYDLHKKYPRHALEPDESNGKSFLNQVLFAASTVSSIGYGGAPVSRTGRAICIFYVLFGLPLFLLTIGDLACFTSDVIQRIYMFAKKMIFAYRQYFKNRASDQKSVTIAGGQEQTAEFLWAYLEKAQIIEPPVWLAYAFLIAYLAFGGMVLCLYEDWSYLDAVYFSTISLLTTGFGDLVPSNQTFVLLSILYVVVGLVLASSVVEMAGKRYLHRLHTMGRRLSAYDPLNWLKLVQKRRIRKMKQIAMANLFNSITAALRVRFDNDAAPAQQQKVIEDEEELKKKVSVVGIGPAPKNLRAIHASATSVTLAWDAPFKTGLDKNHWYTLTYKPRTVRKRHVATFGKASIKNHTILVDFITENTYHLDALQSFTLYEFTLCTTTRFGSSHEVRTQEYTEPSTVPQNLKLEAISFDMATIGWEEPLRSKTAENYTVHYTSEPAPSFKEWLCVDVDALVQWTVTELHPQTDYIACVSANQNFGLAAISKSIRFTTLEAGSNKKLVTPSKHKASALSYISEKSSEEEDTEVTEVKVSEIQSPDAVTETIGL